MMTPRSQSCTAPATISLPDADDDFAKDVSEFDTIAEYRADVRAKMEDANAHHAEHEIEEALIEELIKGLEADIPQVMIDSEVENQVRDLTTVCVSRAWSFPCI